MTMCGFASRMAGFTLFVPRVYTCNRSNIVWNQLSVFVGFIIIFTLCQNISTVSSQETIIFIRSADESASCSNISINASCYTLDEYLQQFSALLVVSQPTTVVFLEGKHYLNEAWLIQDMNVPFSLLGQTSAQVYLDITHPIRVEDSNNIEISSLDFILDLSSSVESLTANNTAFVTFLNSSIELVNVSFVQDGERQHTLNSVQSTSSVVNISDTTFIGNFRALSVSSLSSISFRGTNIFQNNIAEQGGAILAFNSQILLLGMNTFENNAAVQSDDPANGGVIYCYDSRLKINGTTKFVNNTAESEGGAMALYRSKLDVEGSVDFVTNSARFNGGACFFQSSIVSIQSYTSFNGNSVTAPGEIISTQFNLDQISANGGAIYFDDCNTSLSGTTFTNQVSSGSGGAIFMSNGVITLHDIVMINNSATTFYAGGLRAIVGREGGGFMTISGTNVFANNSGYSCGGALEVVSFETVLISGTNNFTNNFAIQGRGSALCFAGTKNVTIHGETHIEGNIGCAVTADFRNNGTGIDSDRRTGTSMVFLGQTYFFNNSYTDGGALCSRFSSISVSNTMVFDSNSATNGAAIASYDSALVFTGDQYFIRNSAVQNGGAIYSENSSWTFTGDQLFDGNSAYQGGAIFATFRNYFTLYGRQQFLNNSAFEGGAMYSFANYVLKLDGEQVFQENTVLQGGGAISTYDTIWTMTGNQQFIGNKGVYGGAMALQGSTSLVLSPISIVNFTQNQAKTFGGAVYFEDSISSIQCSQISGIPKDCFLMLNDSSSDSIVSELSLVFDRNQAGTSGSVMFGGELNYCSLYKGYTDEAGSNDGQMNYNIVDPIQVIRNLSTIIPYREEDALSDITSLPVEVCKCSNNSINCGVNVNSNLTLMPGQTFSLILGVVGQDVNRTVVPAFVLSTQTTDSSLFPPMQSIQNLCAEVSYKLLSNVTNTVSLFEIYPDGPCQALRGTLHLSIQVLPCPPGFVLSNFECSCEERLRKLNKTCFIDSLSVQRERNDIWVKPVYKNGSYDGLLIHRGGCPFDFCRDTPINVSLTDYNVQCAYNHSGTLCGSCRENFSLAFGTLHCLPCSNAYIALILVFIVAGILLVTCLFVLNLTVAIGTINGLIFYANIVQANRHVFFSQGEFKLLEVFVAWLNLDFGIEVCFYNGMNTYVYAWLQFVFPFYVWFLMGFITIVSHYSQTVTKYLGKNPVPVLATLLLLSYTKILDAIIIALSQTRVVGPDERSERVWLYNGDVAYFEGAHIVLALFAISTLLFLFLPYTLLLFSGHWFQTFSNWKVLSWLNKLKPLLDAYYAPFRKNGRYWVGLLLFTRLALIMTFAFNALGSDGINLLAISSVTTALAVMKGRVYEKRANGVLESSFILNLCLFSVVTFYFKANDISQYQVYLSNVSVGIALFTFAGIIIFHIFLRLRTTTWWKRTIKPMFVEAKETVPESHDSAVYIQNIPTSSTVGMSIELREPLLESASDIQ